MMKLRLPSASARFTVATSALVVAACSLPANAASPPVLLGGTSNMMDMLTPANTDAFRAAGGGIYAHQNGWVSNLQVAGEQPNSTNSQNQRKALVNLFRPNNVGHVEFAYGNPADWTNAYRAYYKANGLTADTVSVNFISGRDDGPNSNNYPASNAAAFAYVDAMRAEGIGTVAIILAPNANATDATTYRFDNAYWNDARTRASYGGGWTTDAPPDYFFKRDQNYRDWVVAQTNWTNANGLKSTHIISPHASGPNLFTDSVKYVRYFEDRNAIPDQWAVENYAHVGEPPAGYVNRIGSEDNVNNLAYTAKWLAGHVQGRSQTLDLWSYRKAGTTVSERGKGAFSATPSSTTLNLSNDNLARAFTINLDNLSTDATTGFYAAELSAVATGDTSHWSYVFEFDGVDVTAAVLGEGFTLAGADLLLAGGNAPFTLTIQRLAGATGAFGLNLYARANPSASVVADSLLFVGSAPVPEPASVLALAGGCALVARRRRRATASQR